MHRRLVIEEPVSRSAIWSRRLALFSMTVLLIAVWFFRLGPPTLQGLAPIAVAGTMVLVALGLSVLSFVRIWQHGHRGVGIAGQAFALSLLLLLPFGHLGYLALSRPALTDVSTDIEDPPSFSRSGVVLAARGGVVPPDPAPALRQVQRKAYPRALPIVLELPAETAFALARRAAGDLGWQVLESNRPGGRTGAGRIEAVARTPVLRLVDDITIRVRPRADGSRIDIRSASRLGLHDLGGNAARIAAFADHVALLMETR